MEDDDLKDDLLKLIIKSLSTSKYSFDVINKIIQIIVDSKEIKKVIEKDKSEVKVRFYERKNGTYDLYILINKDFIKKIGFGESDCLNLHILEPIKNYRTIWQLKKPLYNSGKYKLNTLIKSKYFRIYMRLSTILMNSLKKDLSHNVDYEIVDDSLMIYFK